MLSINVSNMRTSICKQCGRSCQVIFRRSYIHPVTGAKVVALRKAFPIPICNCNKNSISFVLPENKFSRLFPKEESRRLQRLLLFQHFKSSLCLQKNVSQRRAVFHLTYCYVFLCTWNNNVRLRNLNLYCRNEIKFM
jgi:hypothetical protein